MQYYQYKYGDRPLEGYTIQRGVGRGGFGEVYYAVSDSGKQVALKTIQTYEQIELRGINHCMNLKSPHLVTVYDVKYNDKGRPFVIMEYVSGPSLGDMIKESGGGLGTAKAAFFLREIAKGLSYLHDCGIVHRDLKPNNIFFEDGRVKIGDYGLSKAMNTSMHSGQTITVGTVHYMAPEIGAGCYNRSIDIYALGILVYEMLTGQVPYFGNSPAEVLMKHMTAEPDLTGVDPTFARVIKKAMAKNPEERYQTVQELVEDVFGAEHIRNSVSQFSPQSLSMAADRIAQKNKPQPAVMPGSAGINRGQNAGNGVSGSIAEAIEGVGAGIAGAVGGVAEGIAGAVEGITGGKVSDGKKQQQQPGPSAVLRDAAAADPISKQQRLTLALIAAGAISVGAALFSTPPDMISTFTAAVLNFAMIFASAKIILMSRWQWLVHIEEDSAWIRRFVTGALAAIAIGIIGSIFGMTGMHRVRVGGAWLGLAIAIAIVDWWKVSEPNRECRVSLGHAIWAGVIGFIFAEIFGGAGELSASVLAGTSLVIQMLSPFVMTKSSAEAIRKSQGMGIAAGAAAAGVGAVRSAAGEARATAGQVKAAVGQAKAAVIAGTGSRRMPPPLPETTAGPRVRKVPGAVKFVWLILCIVFIATGVGLCVAATDHRGFIGEKAMAFGLGFFALWMGLCSFLRIFYSKFTSFFSYLFKPILCSICLGVCGFGGLMIDGARHLPIPVSIGMIIAGGLGFLVLLFTPASVFGGNKPKPAGPGPMPGYRPQPNGAGGPPRPGAIPQQAEGGLKRPGPVNGASIAEGEESPLSRTAALILAVIGFFSVHGLHRFYAGKVWTGLLWFFTVGIFGVGTIIDIILIIVGQFTDSRGRVVTLWDPSAKGQRTNAPRSGHIGQVPPPIPARAGGNIGLKKNAPVPEPAGMAAGTVEAEQPHVAHSKSSVIEREILQPIGGMLSGIFGFLGFAVTMMAMAVGLLCALHFGQVIAAGFPKPEIGQQLTEFFGSSNWPFTLEKIGFFVLGGLLLLATVLQIMGRRRYGFGHIFRVILGNTGLLLVFAALEEAIPDGTSVLLAQALVGEAVGPAIQAMVESFVGRRLIIAAGVFVVSVILLAWPAKKEKKQLTTV